MTLDHDTGTEARPDAVAARRAGAPIAWSQVIRWAIIGTLILVMLVLVDVSRNGGNNPVSLIQPGTNGSATALFTKDFPKLEQPHADGLDGQIYYAIARDPIHPNHTARYLDLPRYRYQRPLLPFTAWLIHPTGGGMGLVAALVFVSFVGVLIFAISAGGLSMTLRGPPWVAALIPLLPGTYWSLRVTVSDALALGLALLAVLLAARDRRAWALVIGCLAVLAKEPVILIFIGWSLFRRTKRDALLTIVPAMVVVAWMGWLHLVLPTDPPRGQDIGLPLMGLVKAWTDVWSHGRELVGMACTLSGLAIGMVALWFRRLRHPLGWAIAIQVGFLLFMGYNPLGTNFGGTRMAMPIMALSIIALATPNAAAALAGVGPDEDDAAAEPASATSAAITAPATAPA